ncbi:hypothetical protein V7157_23405 [Neobacillus drentensis]|uniref:hypothetical protein n=1 Tax=Neobacillus drentensis TaxID=220684 RepID=UPI0030028D5B
MDIKDTPLFYAEKKEHQGKRRWCEANRIPHAEVRKGNRRKYYEYFLDTFTMGSRDARLTTLGLTVMKHLFEEYARHLQANGCRGEILCTNSDYISISHVLIGDEVQIHRSILEILADPTCFTNVSY